MSSSYTTAGRRTRQPGFRFTGFLLSSIARQTPLLSRRTKYILLALVALPLLYTVFTWAPHEPLRFRIMDDAGQAPTPIPSTDSSASATATTAYTTIGVEIQNTSATPICLFKADLTPANGRAQTQAQSQSQTADTGAADATAAVTSKLVPADSADRVGIFHPMEHPERQMSHGRSMLIIPGRSTLHITARVEPAQLDEARTGQLRFQYTWMSDTRRHFSTALHWLRTTVPQSLQSQVPTLTDNWNTCPLETGTGS